MTDASNKSVTAGDQNPAIMSLEARVIAATEAGLPVDPDPFVSLADSLGADPGEVMDIFRDLLRRGAVRRIAAVPNHYRIGYRANGMTVWDVDDDRVDVLGQQVGQLPFVTHCYRRPRHLPGWPYNLFAMVHGASREDVTRQSQAIREILGSALRTHDVLFSKRILKKTGFRSGATGAR